METAEDERAEDRGPHGGRLFSKNGLNLEVTIYERNVPPRFRVYATDDQGSNIPLNQIKLTIELQRLERKDTIRFRASSDYLMGDRVVVELTDNGPGIPSEIADTIFDPFVTTKAPGAGTGLGLNVSHNIVTQKHGGEIAVSSVPGRTTFTVTLPITGSADNGVGSESGRSSSDGQMLEKD